MVAIRQSSSLYRQMLGYLPLLVLALATLAVGSFGQTAMSSPDDVKPVQITGCLSARTKSGGYILSSVFARPVTVVGPNYLQTGMGHQVTLKGTWQSNGIAPDASAASQNRLFIATEVKVTARQCASPPSGPENSASQPTKSPGGN